MLTAPRAATAPRLSPTLYQVAGLGRSAVGGTVALSAAGTVSVTVAGASAVAQVRAVGGRVLAQANGLVSAAVAPRALAALSNRPGISYVAPVQKAYELTTCTALQGNVDPTVGDCSEGIAQSGAQAWQNAIPAQGSIGTGVKIGIVDGGFGSLASEVTAGNLPPYLALDASGAPNSRNHCQDANATVHGTAVTEIVHQMAPDAQLFLYCVDDNVGFAAAEAQAEADGVTIVNSSLGFGGDARGDGTGIDNPGQYVSTSLTVKRARKAGILWIQSAGNSAQDHWSGPLVDADRNGFIDILNTTEDYDYIELAPGASGRITLTWDQWPASSIPVNLDVVEYGPPTMPGGPPVDLGETAGSTISGAGAAPVRVVDVSNTTSNYLDYQISISHSLSQPLPALRYDLSYLGDVSPSYRADPRYWCSSFNGSVETRNAYCTESAVGDPARGAAGSISEPASSPYVLAAGAVYWNGASAAEPFSSRGPTIDGRVKPDLLGFDGTSGPTALYGANNGSSTDPTTAGFFGTSAAAPHIAGAAALIAGANPALDPAEIEALLAARATSHPLAPTNDAGSGVLNLGSPDHTTVTDPPGSKYTALANPTRVFDTRSNLHTSGGAMTNGSTRVVNPAYAGVPSTATAVVVNLTGAGARAPAYLSVFPSTYAGTSNLNLSNLDPIASVAAAVPLDAGHTFRVYDGGASTNVIVDVVGYFAPVGSSATEAGYGALAAPTRILDTRTTLGGHRGLLANAKQLTIPIAGRVGVPADATSVIVNVTATDQRGSGYLSLFPRAPSNPALMTSTLNFGVPTRANLAVVSLDSAGSFAVRDAISSTDVVLDVVGYFARSATATYVALPSPTRIADTRTGNGGRLGPLRSNSDLTLDISGIYGVPHDAVGAWTGVIAVPSSVGFLVVKPAGAAGTTSTLNFLNGRVTANAAAVGVSAAGQIAIHASVVSQAVVDLFGYFR